MPDQPRLERMLDEYDIFRVRRIWAYSRDHHDWERLKTCFHPDATVVVSWFEGSAADFVERTMQAAAARKAEERSAHALGNYDVAVRGDRAILEADMQVLNRDYLDGILFELDLLWAILRYVRTAKRGVADRKMDLYLRQGSARSSTPDRRASRFLCRSRVSGR